MGGATWGRRQHQYPYTRRWPQHCKARPPALPLARTLGPANPNVSDCATSFRKRTGPSLALGAATAPSSLSSLPCTTWNNAPRGFYSCWPTGLMLHAPWQQAGPGSGWQAGTRTSATSSAAVAASSSSAHSASSISRLRCAPSGVLDRNITASSALISFWAAASSAACRHAHPPARYASLVSTGWLLFHTSHMAQCSVVKWSTGPPTPHRALPTHTCRLAHSPCPATCRGYSTCAQAGSAAPPPCRPGFGGRNRA